GDIDSPCEFSTPEIHRLGVPAHPCFGSRVTTIPRRSHQRKSSKPKQRRLLESVLSNCTFDRGSVCPTYKKPFDLFARASETGDWRGRRDSTFSTTGSDDCSLRRGSRGT